MSQPPDYNAPPQPYPPGAAATHPQPEPYPSATGQGAPDRWVGLLLIAGLLLWPLLIGYLPPPLGTHQPPSPPAEVFYYDLGQGALFVGPARKIPPFPAPEPTQSRPEGRPDPPGALRSSTGEDLAVRAYVFSCEGCQIEAQRFIGWLESFPPEQRRALRAAQRASRAEDLSQAHRRALRVRSRLGPRIRSLAEAQWVHANSPQGQRIIQRAYGRCPQGVPAEPCLP
jgi:hypothetical protein